MSYGENFKEILNCVPIADETKIEWDKLEKTRLGLLFRKMSTIKQNPEYHGEGDVYRHTKSVCEELIKLKEYRNCSDIDKTVLFLSALLHDIGKIKCTKTEDGKIVSPGHATKSALMARKLLWMDFGLCGSEEKQQLREGICSLIRRHSFPPYAIKEENPEYEILKAASLGQNANLFSIKKLCILSEADVLGRVCNDREDYLERIECCKILSEELGCIEKPYSFKDSFSQRAYFLKKTLWREQEMFNDAWKRVIMLSGLPGTGKDTWISENCSDLPVVSLDEIRRHLKILPSDNQGKVIFAAQERAKEFLRNKQSFVWNATDITEETRAKWISLFEQYGAEVEIVFLETEWEEQLRRNSNRKNAVPVEKIEAMLSRLEIPQSFECEKVSWKIT